MAIDRTGQWPVGTQASDLDEFLLDAMADGYPIGQVVHAVCAKCTSTTFELVFDEIPPGYAERHCVSCGDLHVMLDCARFADGADPGYAACMCGGGEFEIAAGFSLDEDGEVRWVTIALRCLTDGMLDVYLDWKVDHRPTADLLTQV